MAKKKVLHVAYKSLANGGIQAVIMGIIRNSSDDIDFDIILFTDKTQYYDKEFLEYGNIYRVPIGEKSNRLFNHIEKYYRWLKIFIGSYRILKAGKYDAIHCHNEFEGAFCLLAARFAGVKVRISHAHNSTTSQKNNYFKKIYNSLLRPIIRLNSTVKVGCSKQANDYVFGRKAEDSIVINNSIDLLSFDKTKYVVKEKDFSALKFIHVGRFCYQKNQLFLLEVFKVLTTRFPGAVLTLVGFGEDEDKVKRKIIDLDMEDSVRMMPHDSDIPKLYAESDYMIFPSRFEGLGIVLIEAQVMGVECFASEAVPPEANMGLCTYLSLDNEAEVWANKVIDHITSDNKKIKEVSEEIKEQYDIKVIAKKYNSIYYNID